MSDSPSNKFISFLIIIAAPFAMGAFFLAWSPSQQFEISNPAKDGYVQPRDINKLVNNTSRSTVSVFCDVPKKESIGSGWAVSLDEVQYKEYEQVFITNHHVIEDCIGLEGTLTVALLNKEEVKLLLENSSLGFDSSAIAHMLLDKLGKKKEDWR